LTAEEYQQVQLPWLEDRPDAYRALCVLWASEAFQEKSKKKRHCATKGVNHTFGGDGYIRTAKRMEVATGVEPSPIDVYLRGHRGPDPAHPEVLCSQQASDRLELYGQEMIRRHGENFDWRKGPIDPEALHASGGGKAHGRYSMFTGVVDSRDIQTRRGSSSQSSGCTSSRYRRTEQDAVIENLQEALRAQNEYNLRQQEYQRQQQDWIDSVLQQQHGHGNILPPPPPLPPPPVLPELYPLRPPAAEGSGVNVRDISQCPPAQVRNTPREEDDRATDCPNNLFASGGSGHNSNDPQMP